LLFFRRTDLPSIGGASMLQRSALRKSFQSVVGGGAGLIISLLIGSSLIRTAYTAQNLTFQQEEARAPSRDGAQTLETARSIERELACGRPHAYRIALGAGQYLRVTVEQQGIDVSVALLTSDGKAVAESRGDNGNFGPEIVSMIAKQPVEVRL